ncbi:MAG: single-stranded-DNA-specific exonuclease RecJ [Desulfuromonadaceae bacterium]|nr:single-stranded-DNA-specific exonuclease RecJ [Desulfuromonadaceae bacterium]
MEQIIARRWVLRSTEPDVECVVALGTALNVMPLTARVLALRGIVQPDAGQNFLTARLADLPDPYLLTDMDVAVSRLSSALERGEKITVHGDYDVDGITATALLVENLRACGADCDYFIPLRLEDGYGLSAAAIRRMATAGVALLISVDCGISAVSEAHLAAELGLDLIITDHHQPPKTLPQAWAIIDPHRTDDLFPAKELAGVGVAFMLLVALRQRLREQGWFGSCPEPDLRHSLDLVALGTIADVAPLTGLNRTLIKPGLSLLEHSRRPGITALKSVAGVNVVTPGTVGFQLAPRLNAAGRLEDAALGVELLLSDDPVRAKDYAEQLDACNQERREIERQTCEEAIELAAKCDESHRSLVLARAEWHPGVIGIVASRLVERYHRPTILVALEGDQGKGSARSIPGFNLYRALGACAEYLSAFGGHAYAAGIAITRENLAAFADAFEAVARADVDEDDYVPKLFHDGEITFEEISLPLIHELATLAPYGVGNPEPLFVARAVNLQQIQVVKEKHLKFTVRQGGYSFSAIAFGLAEGFVAGAGALDILFTPYINRWRDRVEIQLRVKALQVVT